jgi:hypothetical protein
VPKATSGCMQIHDFANQVIQRGLLHALDPRTP